MSRNTKSSGGLNKVLTFFGIVDDDRPQYSTSQSFNSGSGYGQPAAYAPNNRQRSASGRDAARRSIPAQGGRSNPGNRRAYDDAQHSNTARRSTRFDDDFQQDFAPQQRQPRSQSRFDDDDRGYQPERPASGRTAAQRPAHRSSGHTVTCTLYTLTDVNPVIKALIRGDTIYMNLYATDEFMERRILDTLSGAVFALEAQFKKPSKEFKSYILAPSSVNIQSIMDLDD